MIGERPGRKPANQRIPERRHRVPVSTAVAWALATRSPASRASRRLIMPPMLVALADAGFVAFCRGRQHADILGAVGGDGLPDPSPWIRMRHVRLRSSCGGCHTQPFWGDPSLRLVAIAGLCRRQDGASICRWIVDGTHARHVSVAGTAAPRRCRLGGDGDYVGERQHRGGLATHGAPSRRSDRPRSSWVVSLVAIRSVEHVVDVGRRSMPRPIEA